MPIFDYCDVVYVSLSSKNCVRLQKTHNACIRYIYNLNYREHISPYRERLEMCKLIDRRNQNLLLFFFKIFISRNTIIFILSV